MVYDEYFDHLKAGGEPENADDVPATVRRISVEEAAALTGVPSIMALHGPVAAQYRQIRQLCTAATVPDDQ